MFLLFKKSQPTAKRTSQPCKNQSTIPPFLKLKKTANFSGKKKQNERFRAKETAVVVATAVASSATWFEFPSLPL